jgi:hypothetical protein
MEFFFSAMTFATTAFAEKTIIPARAGIRPSFDS